MISDWGTGLRGYGVWTQEYTITLCFYEGYTKHFTCILLTQKERELGGNGEKFEIRINTEFFLKF